MPSHKTDIKLLQHTSIKFILMVLAITLVFAGCAGSGGSSNLTNTSSYKTPVLAGTIDPLVGTAAGWGTHCYSR